MPINSRRGFLKLLGLAAPAAALAPKAMLDSGKATDIVPVRIPPFPPLGAPAPGRVVGPYRYLGLAQLKNEGDPTSFDPLPDGELRDVASDVFDDWEDEA